MSFPRSGSTWLRAILATLMYGPGGAHPDVFNRVLPGVSGKRLPLVWQAPRPRLLHSHTTFRRRLPQVVYLVRDGRDTLVSFFHYTTSRRGLKMDFDDWYGLYSRRAYGPLWHDHVTGWLTAGRQRLSDRLLVVQFEALKADSVDTVRHVAAFLDIPTGGDDAIKRAIEQTSLRRAQSLEEHAAGRSLSPDERFYRGGGTGQWRDVFTGETYARFVRDAGAAMVLANYEDRSDEFSPRHRP